MRKKMPRREFLKVAGTTALAVSAAALTGCGGTSGGSTGGSSSSGSNSGSDTPDNGNGGTGDNGNDNNSGSDASEDLSNIQLGPMDYQDTRTAKYFARKGVTQRNVYLEGTLEGDWSGKILFAGLGQNARYREYLEKGDTYTGWNALVQGDTYYELNTRTKQYELWTDLNGVTEDAMKTMAAKARWADYYFMIPDDSMDIKNVEAKRYSVHGKEYYAESMTLWIGDRVGHTMVYCFLGDELKYIVSSPNMLPYTLCPKVLTQNTDASRTKLPADYTQVTGRFELEADYKF